MPPTTPRGPECEQSVAHSPAPPRIELEANLLRIQSGAPLLGLSRVHPALTRVGCLHAHGRACCAPAMLEVVLGELGPVANATISAPERHALFGHAEIRSTRGPVKQLVRFHQSEQTALHSTSSTTRLFLPCDRLQDLVTGLGPVTVCLLYTSPSPRD